MARVRRSVPIKIAADQAVYTPSELRSMLANEAADVLVLGQHETGGLWRLRQMAFIAEVYGVPVNRHGCFETDVSSAASLQVLACIPNLTLGNQLMHPLLTHQILRAPDLTLVEGRIRVPDVPGLGIELDLDALERAESLYRRQGPFPPSGTGRSSTEGVE
jgi:L-alanine-DL-glutamate epimerase-like enolase superfamily enzyme